MVHALRVSCLCLCHLYSAGNARVVSLVLGEGGLRTPPSPMFLPLPVFMDSPWGSFLSLALSFHDLMVGWIPSCLGHALEPMYMRVCEHLHVYWCRGPFFYPILDSVFVFFTTLWLHAALHSLTWLPCRLSLQDPRVQQCGIAAMLHSLPRDTAICTPVAAVEDQRHAFCVSGSSSAGGCRCHSRGPGQSRPSGSCIAGVLSGVCTRAVAPRIILQAHACIVCFVDLGGLAAVSSGRGPVAANPAALHLLWVVAGLQSCGRG